MSARRDHPWGRVGNDEAATPLRRKVETLDTIYRSNIGRLLRLFTRKAGPQDAPDLVQETFARYAAASIERGVEPECCENYLTTVAVNVLRDRNKNAHYRASLYAVPVEDTPLIGSHPQEMLEARDQLERVERALLGLKPLTRNIFIARRYHGYSRPEIAEQTGLSLKAIDKHLAKAVSTGIC